MGSDGIYCTGTSDWRYNIGNIRIILFVIYTKVTENRSNYWKIRHLKIKHDGLNPNPSVLGILGIEQTMIRDYKTCNYITVNVHKYIKQIIRTRATMIIIKNISN